MICKLSSSLLFCAVAMGAGAVGAQSNDVANWPNKPVRIVVPYAAGGSSDTLGRAIGLHLQTAFKQPFVIDNRPGGGGTIGSSQVAKTPPDGYTLVVSGIGSHVIAPVEVKTLQPMTDFTHVAMLGGPATVLVVHPSMQVNTLKEFVALVQQQPDGLTWGSPGQGTHGELIGQLFAQRAKYKQTHIGYKGAAPAVADLAGGQIPAAFITYTSASSFIRSGKIKALAITSPKRSDDIPQVPTFAELGYPELTATTWFSLSGPPSMPPALVEKINAEVRRGMKSEPVRKLMAQEGIESQDWDAPTFTRYVQSEIDRWTPLVKSLGSTRKP
ncbi:Bug family tripartite tricarboxylate transporter substrate binding protein [Hydrogenophaga sp. BPS33]|uniref:Bug family tripartite tricarboxylate transporter substrate binding protein n=1 Tax=Hydrogenophaga sp. BPS33 TaxID=2651974 RepID=UPI001358F266|nr:tripartite tricarboxylate transporter substrate binding protein [Hydrogenophaga sp. BPS33]